MSYPMKLTEAVDRLDLARARRSARVAERAPMSRVFHGTTSVVFDGRTFHVAGESTRSLDRAARMLVEEDRR